MTISITDDLSNVGYAILRLDWDHPGDMSLGVRFLDKTFLQPDGWRTRQAHYFALEPVDAERRSFRLGPEITAHVREAEVVALADETCRFDETVVWEGIRTPLQQGGGRPIRSRVVEARSLPTARPATRDPSEPGRPDVADLGVTVAAETKPAPDVSTPIDPVPRRPFPRPRPRGAVLGALGALFALAMLPPLLVVSGVIGWRAEPSVVALAGPRGGPFAPSSQIVTFERSWYVKPFAHLLFGDAPPFDLAALPAWLDVTQRETGPSRWTLEIQAGNDATRALPVGPNTFRASLDFPLRSAGVIVGCAITLSINQPPAALVLAPDAAIRFEGPLGGPFAPLESQLTFSNPNPTGSDWRVLDTPDWLDVSPLSGRIEGGGHVTITLGLTESARALRATTDRRIMIGPAPLTVLVIVDSAPSTPLSSIDDIACDRMSGNRFDPDHPVDRGFHDEIDGLSMDTIEQGLVACDPSTSRSGPDRRYAVQLGRLLAERAVRRAASGDIDGARRDIDAAVALWQAEATAGSSYAENLLGAYYKGATFNRPGHAFVTPNEETADAYWRMAMMAGNVVAQRNYAAQLLIGLGVPADPDRAMRLLQEALDRGDERSAGVMGVALYTGFPPGVTRDRERGWALIKRAQCVDKAAGALLNREIGRGAQSSAERQAC